MIYRGKWDDAPNIPGFWGQGDSEIVRRETGIELTHSLTILLTVFHFPRYDPSYRTGSQHRVATGKTQVEGMGYAPKPDDWTVCR